MPSTQRAVAVEGTSPDPLLRREAAAREPGVENAEKARAIRLPTHIEHAARTFADAIGLSLNAFISVSVHSCLCGLTDPAPRPAASAPVGAEINKRRQLIRLTAFVEATAEQKAASEGQPLHTFVARCVEGYVRRLEASPLVIPPGLQPRLRSRREA